MTNPAAIPPGYSSLEEWIEEARRLAGHPALKRIGNLLRIDLPPEVASVFEQAAALYNAKGSADPFGEVRDRDGEDQASLFLNLLNMGVQEGLRSVFYHLDRFLFLENEVKRLGQDYLKAAKPKAPNTLGIPSDALVSEYESVTLLSRVTLDRLSRFFTFYFRSHERNLYRLEKSLGNNNVQTPRARAVRAAIDRNREYLDTQISTDKQAKKTERDRIAHREYISWTTVNLMHMPDGSMRVHAVVPDEQLWDRDAGEVLRERFLRLAGTVCDLVSSFFDAGL